MSSKNTGSRSPQIETELQTVTLDDNLSRLMAGQENRFPYSLEEIQQLKEMHKDNERFLRKLDKSEQMIKDAQKA